MADHRSNDTFTFGRIRSPTKREKENRSPVKHESSELRRGAKQTRVHFAESEHSPAATSKSAEADTTLTSPPLAQTSGKAASETPLGIADLETPVGFRNVPTPFGTMGRAALPPTPFAPGSVTPGLNSAAAAKLSSWRSRAANVAFKAKSPPTSRQSSPASSSGMPDNSSPPVTGPSRHSFLTELQSSVLTSSTAASPLTTPGGRPLGRGLDDSPCISGVGAGGTGRGMSWDSPAVVSSERGGAFASPISFPNGPNISSHPSVREALPFGIVDLPVEGEGVPIESSSSPTATSTEEAPQPFGSPSVPLPDAAQNTQTTTAAFSNQATSDIAPMSTWDQLWDEGSSDVPDQAASESPPAESAGQSASTQQAASFDQEAVTLAGFQQDSASHQVAQSHNDAPQAFQELLQSAELPAKTASSGQQSPTQPSSDQAAPSGSARTPAHHASTSSQPQETLPEQASPSLLISSWPDQATTPGPHTSLPDQATPCMPKASAVRGTGAGVTPKTARSKEYGSWWTPPLPKGLTPAWMKMKTPAWVKKMRQLDSDDAPLQPVALDLVPLSPYLKPAPLPDLPQVPRTPKSQQRPKKEKSGFAILCGALLHLMVLLGGAWGSWASQYSMPMMPLYHHHISHKSDATAPYMFSGGFTARPIAATYQYASSMLSRQQTSAQQATPLPSIAEIQQAFHNARQQAPPHMETEFSYDVITAMRETYILDAATVEEPDLVTSEQQDGSDDEVLPAVAAAQTLCEGDEEAHVDGSSLGDAGSGASWQQDESPGLEASLHHSWGRVVSAAKAFVKPISFCWQGSREQPHRQPHAHAAQDENTADSPSHEVYSAYPVVTTDAFSRAWRETRQQAAGMAVKLTSAFQSAADAGAPKRAVSSLHTAMQGPAIALQHSWDVVGHRLSQMRLPLGMSSRDDASSSASSLGGNADSMLPPTQLSSAVDAEGGVESDPVRGLADASADLMQSLDNLLESLESPQADESVPDTRLSDSISTHQELAQHPDSDIEAASGISSATLVPDARTEPGIMGLLQRAPWFQGFVDERPSPSTGAPSTAQEGNSRSWASLLHAAKPLTAIVAATTGIALLAQLFFRSHMGDDEAEELTSPERRRSVSRRLSASFSAMQNAASGEDAVSSAAAAVEAAEEAEYSIGHKAVTQLPQSKTPARPRATAAETEHPRGQYLLRSREVTQVGSQAHQQAIGEVSSKSTVRRSSRHKQ